MTLRKRFEVQAWVSLGLIIFAVPFAFMTPSLIIPWLIGVAFGQVFWPVVFWMLDGRPSG